MCRRQDRKELFAFKDDTVFLTLGRSGLLWIHSWLSWATSLSHVSFSAYYLNFCCIINPSVIDLRKKFTSLILIGFARTRPFSSNASCRISHGTSRSINVGIIAFEVLCFHIEKNCKIIWKKDKLQDHYEPIPKRLIERDTSQVKPYQNKLSYMGISLFLPTGQRPN